MDTQQEEEEEEVPLDLEGLDRSNIGVADADLEILGVVNNVRMVANIEQEVANIGEEVADNVSNWLKYPDFELEMNPGRVEMDMNK